MVAKKVSIMDFEGNPNIGIYMFVNDKFCILGRGVKKEKKDEIAKALNVPVFEVTILGTNLNGIFLAGDNNILLAPQMHEYELKNLQKICDDHNVKLIILEHKFNTLGNNVCVAENRILLGSDYEKNEVKKIREETKYEIVQIKSDKFQAIGSTFKFLNKAFFISQEYDESEVKGIVNEVAAIGTINKGSNYISSGIVGNKFGVIIGSASTSVEIQNVVESLDYL